MSKFICVKTGTNGVPLGTVVEGSICMYGSKVRILVSEDSEVKLPNGSSFFRKGVHVPLKGNLWEWQEDALDVLDRFEKAVRADEMRGAQDTEDAVLIEEAYEAAKADLLKALGK